ncbi:hypothetical protein, partial [Vibrio cholerae]|uniref:hypothetical protein n=1 Tax=Vibrio cholerae TaxID=666 RepID=UPI001AB0247C
EHRLLRRKTSSNRRYRGSIKKPADWRGYLQNSSTLAAVTSGSNKWLNARLTTLLDPSSVPSF